MNFCKAFKILIVIIQFMKFSLIYENLKGLPKKASPRMPKIILIPEATEVILALIYTIAKQSEVS